MAVRAVVFDAMGTVIEPSPSVADVYQTALKKHCGLDLAASEIHSALKTALKARSAGTSLETDEDAESAFWDGFIRDLANDVAGRQACFDELFLHFARSANWRCFDDVAETIDRLSARGLILGIASNFDRRLHAVLDGLPEFRNVPHRIVSSEVGWRKPSPRFFEAVCREIDISADEVLVVGDDLTNDVCGAIEAGCRAAWIDRGRTAAELPAGGIRLSQLTELPDHILSGNSS